MNIELNKITIRELSKNFKDNAENGVTGFDGKLDIRPPYQREFIYKDKQRDAVINTVIKKYPLNVMYWAASKDTTFEVIDGQQRTISICQYVNGDFAYQNRYFHNLKDDEKEQILDYTLMVYVCSGTESEKLEWFKTINIAGEKLTEQELRNAVYTGAWVSSAKTYFSKTACAASKIGSDYLNGSVNRQEYLETVIGWINNDDSDDGIKRYMAKHQHDPNATALWLYFQSVMTWVDATFTNKRKKFMNGIAWGLLYNTHKDVMYDTKAIEVETAKLIADDEVERKSGIYAYILTRDERYLGIRTFSDSVKQKVYEKQGRKCIICKNEFDISEMEGDHITPWKDNGKTTEENCQMLCKNDNRRKSDK